MQFIHTAVNMCAKVIYRPNVLRIYRIGKAQQTNTLSLFHCCLAVCLMLCSTMGADEHGPKPQH